MSKQSATPSSSEPPPDPLSMQRGDYSRSLTSTKLFFAAFRAITGPAQYLIITSLPLARFGIPPPPTGGTIVLPGIAAIGLRAATWPKYPLMMAVMPTVLSAKHIYWVTRLMRESMTVPFAVFGVLADIVYESITSLVFTTAASNPMFSAAQLKIGFGMYIAGVLTELICELQRDSFKSDPANKGKICDRGLWGIVRHPNYTANIVFGFFYGLAAGGIGYALCTGGMYLSNLSMNAGPSHEEYMKKKYGAEWERYEKKVPWKLFPGIF